MIVHLGGDDDGVSLSHNFHSLLLPEVVNVRGPCFTAIFVKISQKAVGRGLFIKSFVCVFNVGYALFFYEWFICFS